MVVRMSHLKTSRIVQTQYKFVLVIYNFRIQKYLKKELNE